MTHGSLITVLAALAACGGNGEMLDAGHDASAEDARTAADDGGSDDAGRRDGGDGVRRDAGTRDAGDVDGGSRREDGGPCASVADLALAIADAPDPLDRSAGTVVTHTFTITNAGPDDVASASATVLFSGPIEVQFIDSTRCRVFPGEELRCFSLSIPAGDRLVITSRSAVTAVADVTAEGSVTSTACDPDPSDDRASESTTVVP